MKLLFLLGYFFFGMNSQEVELALAADLMKEIPRVAALPAGEKLKIKIEIDAEGRVSAVSGVKKLAAFDSTNAAGMKPLADWMTGLKGDGPPAVSLKVAGAAQQAIVIGVLNVLAEKKVVAVTFTDLLNGP